jgi:predicted oxidoreductase
VRVAAAITHTIGGLRVDERARVRGVDGQPLDGLYAAGADVGGISTGGYASGLASALVLGRAAAEDAVR